jgi:hypothetical protein
MEETLRGAVMPPACQRQRSAGEPTQVTAMEKPLDVVIKTRAEDLIPFLQLQADLARHSRLHGCTYVIVPRDELHQFVDVVQKDNILLTAEEVAAVAGYTGEFPDTWFTQQIIKIAAANVVRHQHYLILDSNTLLGFDFDEHYLLSNGNYVYAVNEFHDVAWELQSRNFLRLHTPGRLAGFRAANQIFSKQNAQALIRRVETLYEDNIVRILLGHSDSESTVFWTEFALYGVFVRSLQEAPGHCFEERHDLIHYSARWNFTHFLSEVEAEGPLMIKFNKRRHHQYDLSSADYADRISAIKSAYQRRLIASAPS